MAEQESGREKFEENLYLVIVNTNIYHYVYCGYDTIMRERACLQETGQDHRVQFVGLNLTDFDTINHVHFC